MNKFTVVQTILEGNRKLPIKEIGEYFAPSNIALCKYWGKRDTELNLPYNSSFSVSLGSFGAKTRVEVIEAPQDQLVINGMNIGLDSPFALQLIPFLNLLRFEPKIRFKITSQVNLPIGAGLASSACGYAALVGALNELYGWQLPLEKLSILARLGSGSACRSFWQGFVEWQKGELSDGMDSVGKPYPEIWPSLRVGLLILSSELKSISSRVAMENTVSTSPFYTLWPSKHQQDELCLKNAIHQQDFNSFGETVESNALSMHALMLTATPSILYSLPETVKFMHQIWSYRAQGLNLYFTQDAGPNLKLLFLEKDQNQVVNLFPNLKIIAPFAGAESKVVG